MAGEMLTIPTAITLADYTRAGLMIPQLRGSDAPGILGELSQALQQQGCLADVLPFYHAALNQELLNDSALESGIALPHARTSGIRDLQFALGRAPRPILWGNRRSAAVDLVFLMAVPPTDAARYLNLLASLARLGQQAELLAEIRDAHNAEALLAVLNKVRIRP